MSGYVTPVEVVTPKGTARHAALIPAGAQKEWLRSVPSFAGVCGRSKNARVLLRVEYMRERGIRADGPYCRACWRQVALDEGVTS